MPVSPTALQRPAAYWKDGSPSSAHGNSSSYWSSRMPCFTNTQWRMLSNGHNDIGTDHSFATSSSFESLRRTMAGHWWSVSVFLPKEQMISRSPSLSASSVSEQLTASAWRQIIDCALQRIDNHPLPGDDEIQPWRKQQQAMMKTAQKKANRSARKKKNNDNTTTQETTTPSEKQSFSNKQQKGKEEEAVTKNKKKKHKREKGKERVPLDDDPKEDGKQKDKEEKVISFDGKCRKICVFLKEDQKLLIKRWMGTYRWTYNACNAAVRAGLCGFSTDELRARFLSSEAFGKASGRSANGKGAAKKKKLIAPLTKKQSKVWRKALEPTGHWPSRATWVLDTPSDIRDQAIKELTQAYSNGLEVHGSLAAFEVKFKSLKKLSQQTITIGSHEWNRIARGHARDSVYCQLFNRGNALWSREELPEMMTRDFKLVRTRLGRYYLCIPTDLNDDKNKKKKRKAGKKTKIGVGGERASENPVSSSIFTEHKEEEEKQIGRECVFIDPGVRTFITSFDLQGRIHEFGKGSIKRIERLCYYLDDLISRTDAKRPEDKARFVLAKKKRWKMRRAALRMRRRIRNLIDEAHRKIALWLCGNYRVIVWPLSGVKNMVTKKKQKKKERKNKHSSEEKKEKNIATTTSSSCDESQQRKAQLKECKRRIGRKTVRAMLTWSWYRFQQWLKHKVRQFPDCRLVLASEAYTTKTCTICGQQNNNVGGDEVFRCVDVHCANRAAPRDHHGARNIGVRFLTEWASAKWKKQMGGETTSAQLAAGAIMLPL